MWERFATATVSASVIGTLKENSDCFSISRHPDLKALSLTSLKRESLNPKSLNLGTRNSDPLNLETSKPFTGT